MNPISRVAVDLLGLMLIIVVIIALERTWHYRKARIHSEQFVASVDSLLAIGKLDDTIRVANRFSASHIASITLAGLEAFVSAPLDFDRTEAVALAQNAMRRTRNRLRLQLEANLRTLATIVATAPFIGLVGTVFEILLDVFRGWGASKWLVVTYTITASGESLVPTAAGVPVAVLATWFYNYFHTRLEIFNTEMSNTSLEMVDYLTAHNDLRTTTCHEEQPILTTAQERYDMQRILLLAVGGCGLYIAQLFVRAAL